MTKNLKKVTTLLELLYLRVQNQHDKCAYTFLVDGETEEVSLTYAQLDQQARIIAAKLQSTVAMGERALLLYPSGLDYIAAFFGCLYAGVVAVPVYSPRRNRSDQRIQAIATDSGATLILTTSHILSTVAQRLAHSPELKNRHWLTTDTLSNQSTHACQVRDIQANTLAFLQYTSGSTGTPKGVMVSHGNLLHNLAYMSSIWQFNLESIMVTWLPIFHDMGLIFGILQPFYHGATCYLMSSSAFVQSPFRWLQAISRYQATHSGAPNFAYELCVNRINEKQRATLDLSSWEMSLNGAEPVRSETIIKFNEYFKPCGLKPTTLCHGYGLAEATLVVGGAEKPALSIYYSIQNAALEQGQVVAVTNNKQKSQTFVGCGQPAVDASVVITNPKTQMPCPANEIGEIWLSSPSVAHGYWQRPVETTDTFQAYLADTGEGPFLRTGDLGFFREDGELFITGRLKDIIIIRGGNYYPQDIELTVEKSHSALRASCGAAFSVNVTGEEQLVIAQEVERTALKKLNDEEVVSAIRQAVAEQHDLQTYAILLLRTATIPKTSSGKIQRAVCKVGFLEKTLETVVIWQQDLSTKDFVSHQNRDHSNITAETIQTWLLTRLSILLNVAVPKLNVQEPFARYGLDSMTAVSLSGELGEWLKRSVSPTLLYDYPSIQALSQYLAGELQPTMAPKPPQIETKSEAIAVIGMSCRFPGAKNIQEFWQLLCNGQDAITEVPLSRWNFDEFYASNPSISGKMNTRWGGFLDQVTDFDPQFFGISPVESAQMDPQQRLLLEVSWEALENAGIVLNQLAGHQTGVFIGISTNDYAYIQSAQGITATNVYSGTSNAFSIAANRLSYCFDLRGPSIAVDTACSSSLTAVHQACQNLRWGECDLALAGGVNLMLTPALTLSFSQAGMLAADGRCKTFDASADGYVRGEGCGIVLLKRFEQAVKDGDTIFALVKGSAVNQDGRSNGITAPNGLAQQAVIRQALANAQITPAQISYVEAHGTGTALGDPIEFNALANVLQPGRSPQQPAWIGSVKTNIGHLEAAAGIAGLIKVVLALQHQQIPPHLHLQTLNPHLAIADTSLAIPTALQPWDAETRFAGVSSFGLGGTNAHVILASAPQQATVEPAQWQRTQQILTLSAKSEPALRALAKRYADYLHTHPDTALADLSFTTNTGRAHFPNRLAAVATATTQLAEQLRGFIDGKAVAGLRSGRLKPRSAPKLAFLFTGQGAQYVGMGQQLYATQPVFRQTLEQCTDILRPYLEKPLLEVLYPTTAETNSLLNETRYTQPALFALEYALVQLWQSWGITPAVVMGHSVGEYVAAGVAGVFSLEDGLKLIAERGRLMQALPPNGTMVAVNANETQVNAAIEPYTDEVSIAAINGPQNIVISGKQAAIEAITATLKTSGIKTQLLAVSHAFHSPLMEPMLAEFQRVATEITYHQPQIALCSNITGDFATDEIATPEYWCRHLRQPVKFAASMATLEQNGYNCFVEIGPKPTLLGMGRQCLPDEVGVWLPSLREGQTDWQPLLQSLGELYMHGMSVNWSGFDQDYSRRRVQLPTYPFQRQRYWFNTFDTYENQDKATQFLSVESPIFKLLQQGKTKQLVQQLEKTEQLSKEEQKYLPNILNMLARQYQQQVAIDSIKDWFYEVKWHPQTHQGQQLPPDYLPTPKNLYSNLLPQLETEKARQDLKDYWQLLEHIEALSIDYILNMFQKMGFLFQQGQRFSTSDLEAKLGIVNRSQWHFNRLLEMLVEVGVLQHHAKQWSVAHVPELKDPQTQWCTLITQYPLGKIELTMLERCGSQLAEVLQGVCDPLQLLFPEGDLTTATSLYQDTLPLDMLNTLIQQVVKQSLANLPQPRQLRILEIGAGTGATSSYLLPHLPSQQTEYIFTDLSKTFLNQAQEKFHNYPFIQYKLLDIEQNIEEQGFNKHQYDLIIAVNVLHATQNLQQSVQHVRQLLMPKGLLILLESTEKSRFIDLMFGSIEGWSRFNDYDLRPTHPFLSAAQWQALLENNGFQQTITLSASDEQDEMSSKQAVIIAQADQLLDKTENIAPVHWLIFADEQGMAQQLNTYLQAKGDKCTLVFPGEVFEQLSIQKYQLNPTNLSDFQKLFDNIKRVKKSELAGVQTESVPSIIYLWSLDIVTTNVLTTPKSTLQKALDSTPYLIQAVSKAEFSTWPKLWLVTQGATTVTAKLSLSGLAQSPLLAMGKLIALEYPDLNVIQVDLEPNAQKEEAMQTLCEEIWAAKTVLGINLSVNETQIAFRDNIRYVARLARHIKTPMTSPVTFCDNASYLIAGGLDGLGLIVADWMVQQGAKHLVLIGHNAPTLAVQQKLKLLEQAGTQIKVSQTNISDAEQLTTVLSDIKQSLPPLQGIINVMNVPIDGTLQQLSQQGFAPVIIPSISGAWHLHQLTQSLSLDFFVLVSTSAALNNCAGEATVHAFLETLAHYRQSIGLPALTINWGPWAEGCKTEMSLKAKGVETIVTQPGLQALAYLLTQSAPQMEVIPINWSQFPQQLIVLPFFAAFKPAINPIKAEQSVEFIEQFKVTSPNKRRALLMAHVRSQVAKVLRLNSADALDPKQGFFDLGMDSLTSVELRNHLQKSLKYSLPATLAFNYPTTEELVNYLLKEVPMLVLSSTPPAQKTPQEETQTELANLETLTDDEIGALIDNTLNNINI